MAREEDDAVIEMARLILKRRVRRNTVLTCPSKVRDWLQMEFSGYGYEVFHVTYLDNQHRILHHEELFKGTIDGAAVYPRRVVEECLRYQSAAVILAHNHPSGVAEPSSADRRITDRLKSALALIDVRVLDHIIVCSDSSYSFAEFGLI